MFESLINSKHLGIVHRPLFWWFLPHYLTFHWINGRRGPIIHELAAKDEVKDEAKDETTGCNLEAHQTVRLLNKKRNVDLSPLDNVPLENDHRYKWTLKGNSQVSIYEQPLDPKEEQLLRKWKAEAQIWQRPEFQQETDEEYDNHNGRDVWKGVTQDEVWGFEESGKFDESLVKEICDNVEVAR